MGKTATDALVRPALRDLHAAIARQRPLMPGGQPMPDDLDGIARGVARRHGITPDDLKRWYAALGRAERAGLSTEISDEQ